MAYPNGLGERAEDYRFRNPTTSSRDEAFSGYSSITSPLRGLASRLPNPTPSAADLRGSLQRRFTTNTVPTISPLSPIGQQRRQAAENTDLSMANFHKTQAYEKKRLEYEYLREQRRRLEAEMELFELRTRQKESELNQLTHDFSKMSSSGHQSEPTTPPEYREAGFPTSLSRPNRFSSASLTSPPGLSTRPSRSGSQLTSPPSDFAKAFGSQVFSHHIPSKSVPGSRRGSDEDEDPYLHEEIELPRKSGASLNRYSMPVTGYSSRAIDDEYSSHINTTRFLFNDEDDKFTRKDPNPAASPEVKTYLQAHTNDENFPILVRNNGNSNMQLSASSAALDLAFSQSSDTTESSNGWPSFARHKAGQQSLPVNTLRSTFAQSDDFNMPHPTGTETPKSLAGNRRSMEVKFTPYTESKRGNLLTTPPNGTTNGAPKLQSSYSTNDIPTLKSTNGFGASLTNGAATPKTHAEQHFHNHNVSIGRIPQGAVSNRQSRDLSGIEVRTEQRAEEPQSAARATQSSLQATAASFGPPLTSSSSPPNSTATEGMSSPTMSQYSAAPPAYYGGYGMQMLNSTMNSLSMAAQPTWNQQVQQVYQNPYNGYGAYQQYNAGNNRYGGDSQTRVIQQRRAQNGEENSRYSNVQLESLQGEIYGLCKDQHGCRFLQRKLEDQNLEHVRLIFEETKDHVVELMTDPFGNYLCQKLLEYTNDEQRTVLINNAAPQMVKIALNQHGTRALQKMIEFISTREQIQTIILALENQVVQLIQDLNGNHVIQKCLNHLSSQDAQFIFDAVGRHCVVVGTHRHGCCVLQRCIDHASGAQKANLVQQITASAFELVQDPFGNYVVQYILDLGEPAFSKPISLKFLGHVPALSKQKFSSNVVEKCIRTADNETRRLLCQELVEPQELDRLIRDSFGNYVFQTAMDFADQDTKGMLIEAVRPILPGIRTTPYGRRIQSKINEYDGQLSANNSGHVTPHGATTPGQIPINGMAHAFPGAAPNAYPGMNSGFGGPVNAGFTPPHHLGSPNHQSPAGQRNANQPTFPAYGRGAPQSNGMNYI